MKSAKIYKNVPIDGKQWRTMQSEEEEETFHISFVQ